MAFMGLGTIHPIDDDLYWIEGRRTETLSDSAAGCAVLRTPHRTYLLNTGSGREQAASISAVTSSFPAPEELVLLSTGDHGALSGNNDLLHRLAAVRHHHLRLEDLSADDSLRWGTTRWTGWGIDPGELVVLRCSPRSLGLSVYLPHRRVLILPAGLKLAHPDQPAECDPRMVTLLTEGLAEVVLPPFGKPLDPSTARSALAA